MYRLIWPAVVVDAVVAVLISRYKYRISLVEGDLCHCCSHALCVACEWFELGAATYIQITMMHTLTSYSLLFLVLLQSHIRLVM